MADETGLPTSFLMAWGIRDRPTKGPRPGLSLEAIVGAAIEVANADGIGGVSMNRVAKELGSSAMSLYRYVASKDELLALMIDGAFGQVEWTPIEGDWRARLTQWSEVVLAGYRQFPWILRIPIAGAPIMPHQLRFLEQGLRALGDTGLAEHEKLSTCLLVTSFTRSFALLSSDLAAALEAGIDPTGQSAAGYAAMIKRLTTREEFPALHTVIDDDAFAELEDDDLEYDYRFGLERILDGIEALVRVRE